MQRLEICRSIGDRVTESCALCNLGNCFRAIGKLEEALQYYILVRVGEEQRGEGGGWKELSGEGEGDGRKMRMSKFFLFTVAELGAYTIH